MKMYHFADAGKTNPIQTQTNPISKAKKNAAGLSFMPAVEPTFYIRQQPG